MNIKTKDEIIKKLITDLEKDGEWILTSEDQKEYLINKGWIKSLKWVLGINNEEVFTEGKNTLVVKER